MKNSPPPLLATKKAAWRGSPKLTESDLAQLSRTFARQIRQEQRTEFLNRVVSEVSIWRGFDENKRAQIIENETKNSGGRARPHKKTEPITTAYSEIEKRIDAMETAAKSLQSALQGLENAPYDFIAPHFRYLLKGKAGQQQIPIRWSNENMRFKDAITEVWESLSALQETGKYARKFLPKSRQTQPQYDRSRSFISRIIQAYVDHFLKPPSGGKDHWFTEFVSVLCKLLPKEDAHGRDIGISGGRDLLTGVIKKMEAKRLFPKTPG